MRPLPWCYRILVLFSPVWCEIATPVWQQYYSSPGYTQPAALSDSQHNFRYRRVRVGQGKYRILPSGNAEIDCEFPNSMLLISEMYFPCTNLDMTWLEPVPTAYLDSLHSNCPYTLFDALVGSLFEHQFQNSYRSVVLCFLKPREPLKCHTPIWKTQLFD